MREHTYIVCDLPAEQHRWRPDPFPGSEEAFNQGCTCPEAQPWPGSLAFATDCPVHELYRPKPYPIPDEQHPHE